MIKGSSVTKIPEGISEIGRYAFAGNNLLENITIPESVEKINNLAFYSCYGLKTIIMPKTDITFGLYVFDRAFLEEDNLTMYVYKDSNSKQYAVDNDINYRHIDPDEVSINLDNNKFNAFDSVNVDNLTMTLIYNEKEQREEVLTTKDGSLYIEYQDNKRSSFRYGDKYFTAVGVIILGDNWTRYLINEQIPVEVSKAIPKYTIPEKIQGEKGQKLSEIELPPGFEWMNSEQIIEKTGDVVFKTKYIPDDTDNYEIVVDRHEAIQRAVDLAKDKDIVLVLGKGNETYQKLKNETIYFNDVEEAYKAVENRKEREKVTN